MPPFRRETESPSGGLFSLTMYPIRSAAVAVFRCREAIASWAAEPVVLEAEGDRRC